MFPSMKRQKGVFVYGCLACVPVELIVLNATGINYIVNGVLGLQQAWIVVLLVIYVKLNENKCLSRVLGAFPDFCYTRENKMYTMHKTVDCSQNNTSFPQFK